MSENIDTSLWVETWYSDNELSIAFVALKGRGAHVRNMLSETTYEVISGHGIFRLDDDDCILLVGPGDKLTIGPDQGYQDQGNLVMLATSRPPYDARYVELL